MDWKKDCFGMGNIDGHNVGCQALNKTDCEECGFYKTKAENDAQLMQHNGTTDLRKIKERYAAGVKKGA